MNDWTFKNRVMLHQDQWARPGKPEWQDLLRLRVDRSQALELIAELANAAAEHRPETFTIDVVVDHGISLVLDVSLMIDAERTRFMTAFGARFFQRKKRAKGAVHVILDEGQDMLTWLAFAPDSGNSGWRLGEVLPAPASMSGPTIQHQ